jgi:hypothetical protein
VARTWKCIARTARGGGAPRGGAAPRGEPAPLDECEPGQRQRECGQRDFGERRDRSRGVAGQRAAAAPVGREVERVLPGAVEVAAEVDVERAERRVVRRDAELDHAGGPGDPERDGGIGLAARVGLLPVRHDHGPGFRLVAAGPLGAVQRRDLPRQRVIDERRGVERARLPAGGRHREAVGRVRVERFQRAPAAAPGVAALLVVERSQHHRVSGIGETGGDVADGRRGGEILVGEHQQHVVGCREARERRRGDAHVDAGERVAGKAAAEVRCRLGGIAVREHAHARRLGAARHAGEHQGRDADAHPGVHRVGQRPRRAESLVSFMASRLAGTAPKSHAACTPEGTVRRRSLRKKQFHCNLSPRGDIFDCLQSATTRQGALRSSSIASP